MVARVRRVRRVAPAAQPPLPFARVGDLPRFWDGRAVLWKGWRDDWDQRFAPRPAMECAACGSTAKPATTLGRVAESPLYSHAMMEADDAAAARLPPIARDRFKPRGRSFYRLMVFRCRDCGYDMVLDDTGSEWELDDDDYAPDGSWPR